MFKKKTHTTSVKTIRVTPPAICMKLILEVIFEEEEDDEDEEEGVEVILSLLLNGLTPETFVDKTNNISF